MAGGTIDTLRELLGFVIGGGSGAVVLEDATATGCPGGVTCIEFHVVKSAVADANIIGEFTNPNVF